MIIPCVLWAFVGYFFGERYLKMQWQLCLMAALIMMIFVIQIERQVILSSSSSNKGPLYFRAVIALAMAVIGSLIMDQILFKEDIEQQKIIMMDEKVRRVFPSRSAELKRQLTSIDSSILYKENERRVLVSEISRNPTIPVYTRRVIQENRDSITSETITRTSSQIQNPKIALLEPLDAQIAGLRVEKMKKDSMLLVLRPIVEAELKDKVGFLDELNLMISILTASWVAMSVWGLFFCFFLGIEIFVLVSKWNEHETDYDEVIKQQEMVHRRRLELLGKM